MHDKRKYQRRDREYWRSHVSHCEESGLSQTEYCRRNNIPFSSFGNWKTKLSQTKQNEPLFVEINHGVIPMREMHIELVTTDGMVIRLRESIQRETLQNIVLALRGL